MEENKEDKIKKIVEKHLPKAVGEFTNNMSFLIDVFSEVYDEAQKEVYSKYISKWEKEIKKYSDTNRYKSYSQTYITEFKRDLKELEENK